jgi:ABC-2 type transport system permease protein
VNAYLAALMLLVAAAGLALLLIAAGAATGLGYGLRATGTGPETARLAGAALAQLPAALVITAVAALACGAAPGTGTAIGWADRPVRGPGRGGAGRLPPPRHFLMHSS